MPIDLQFFAHMFLTRHNIYQLKKLYEIAGCSESVANAAGIRPAKHVHMSSLHSVASKASQGNRNPTTTQSSTLNRLHTSRVPAAISSLAPSCSYHNRHADVIRTKDICAVIAILHCIECNPSSHHSVHSEQLLSERLCYRFGYFSSALCCPTDYVDQGQGREI